MTRTHAFLHPFGWGALAGGIVVAALGKTANSEFAGLAWTYGVLVVLAAAYLLIGLRVLAAVRARRQARAASRQTVSQTEASGA